MSSDEGMFIADDDQITTGEEISNEKESIVIHDKADEGSRSPSKEEDTTQPLPTQGSISKHNSATQSKPKPINEILVRFGTKRKQTVVQREVLQPPLKKRKPLTQQEILKLADKYADEFSGTDRDPTLLDGMFDIKVAKRRDEDHASTLSKKKNTVEKQQEKIPQKVSEREEVQEQEEVTVVKQKMPLVKSTVQKQMTVDQILLKNRKDEENDESELDGYTFKIHPHLLPQEGEKFYGKSLIPEFQCGENESQQTVNHLQTLNYIIRWINIRLVMRQFNKNISGIYIWSYSRTNGKTLLCHTLSRIFKSYWWSFEDKHWQQDWKENTAYEFIVYNGVNSDCVSFRQIECHGDEMEIQVAKRNKHQPSFIKANMPYIMTSNKTMETLGYDEKGLSTDIWKERLLSVCVDDKPLFPLIALLRRHFNLPSRRNYDSSWAFESMEI